MLLGCYGFLELNIVLKYAGTHRRRTSFSSLKVKVLKEIKLLKLAFFTNKEYILK